MAIVKMQPPDCCSRLVDGRAGKFIGCCALACPAPHGGTVDVCPPPYPPPRDMETRTAVLAKETDGKVAEVRAAGAAKVASLQDETAELKKRLGLS